MSQKKRGHSSGSMSLTCLLFVFLTLIPFTLRGQEKITGRKITVSARNKSINQILERFTLQTGYFFTYNAELIDWERKVDFHAEELELNDALDSLLGDPGLDYRVIQRNIVIYRKNDSPPRPIIREINHTLLSGRVVDQQTGKPLPFATLALYGTNLGTITNQAGGFSFKIPGTLKNPMLAVSYIGYQNLYVPVQYPLDKEIVIELEKETVPLQEVIIRYTDPEALLSEAVSRIPSNYLEDHSVMTAFYRESVSRNDRTMIYSEAVLDVAKGPYTSLSAGDQVRIRKGRKIADVTREDSVLIKLRSGIHTSLDLDVVKDRPDFLTKNLLSLYDVDFTDMVTYHDRLVYVLSFRQKEHITDLLFQGEIYIDHENLAIVAVDFEYNPRLIRKEPGLFLVRRSPSIHIRPLQTRYHADYRELDGKFHLSQVRAEVEMRVRKRRQWIGARYRIGLELAITDVVAGERLRISRSERVPPNTVLTDQPFEFDPLFWGVYNTIQPEASLKESIQRIEHNLQEITGHRSNNE